MDESAAVYGRVIVHILPEVKYRTAYFVAFCRLHLHVSETLAPPSFMSA